MNYVKQKQENTKHPLPLYASCKSGAGFSMIEVTVSVLVGSVLLVTFLTLVTHSAKIERANKETYQAELYLREMIEVAKDLEGSNWTELTSCQDIQCHPEISGTTWTLISDDQTINGIFTRSMTIEAVQRDNGGTFPNNIVETGGNDDPNTKKIVGTISWETVAGPRTRSLEAYVYNYE
ncbi:MAG: hypothetical protein HY445_00990 [Candidatus Niyogibacteria bacterium]|nr:hypothetical protein [Candidatus Niyogibacteria bacterium]